MRSPKRPPSRPAASESPPARAGAAGPVGRGGGKLEAAIARFGLEDAIRGAQAVDVGASTGGFTQALLRHGAVHVVAVDVGHGQLHPELRRDPRVESLERTDWKRLALSVAPGPFDFFSVDVSFVAARNMLRSLAFRLRPGAQGVVLVKPQFELPDHLVKGGDVSDPALRARALALFTEKAEALGFRIGAVIDSPVAGGSGTVELLAHLHFPGRSEKLPAPGERRARPAVTPAAATRAFAPRRWFAVAAPGLEEVVRAEIAALPGAAAVTVVPGGVEFEGPLELGLRANLHARVASRIWLRLGTVEAREFGRLRRGLAKLPWDALVPTDRPLRITAAASRCRLYHTGALAEQLTLAVGDRVGKLPPPAAKAKGESEDADAQEATAAEDADETRLLLRGQGDAFTVSVDASGALLHRRGWRLEAGKAPLRETLAAGILALAGYDPSRPLVDPMCGAGTIALEAAAIAKRRAPGLGRAFAFERWPLFDEALWARLRAEAEAVVVPAPAAIRGFDRDARAVEIARRNAERAGLVAEVAFEVAAASDASPPEGPGLAVANPPYGRRLGSPGGTGAVYRDLGQALRRQVPGWRAAVLVPDRRLAGLLGLRGVESHAVSNGGMRVTLVVGDVVRGGGGA
jgi:putative N6-adenine-specific DNA methylase